MAVSSWVESVEFIETTLAGTSDSISLTKGQDYRNCIPFFTVRTTNTYYDSINIDTYFSGTTESGIINFTRYNSRANTYIKCYVVEFNPDEVKVQQGTFDISTSQSDTVNLPTVISGGINKAAMIHHWQCSNGGRTYNHHGVRGRVVSSGTLDFYRNGTGGSCDGHWFLFEDLGNNFTVSHLYSSDGGGGKTLTIDNNRCVSLFRTFLISSSASSDNSDYPQRAGIRSYIHSAGSVRWDRYDGNGTKYFAAQVFEFIDQTKVYTPFDHYNPSLAAGTTTLTREVGGTEYRVPFLCNPETTSVVSAGPRGMGRCDTSVESAGDEMYMAAWLSASGTITHQRGHSSYNSYPSYTIAVDWAGITVSSGTASEVIPEGDGPGQSFVKTVENFRITVEDYLAAREISKGQDWRNCALFVSHRANAGDHLSDHLYNVNMIEPGIVTVNCSDASGQGLVDISVVEFWPNQVKVQHGTFYTGGVTNITIPVEPVSDVNKAFVLHKEFNPDSTYYPNDVLYRVNLATTSGIELNKYAGGNAIDIAYFLVEDLGNNFETRHFTETVSSTVRYFYNDDLNFNRHATFIIGNYANSSTADYPQRNLCRGYYAFESNPFIINKLDSNGQLNWTCTAVRFVSDKYRVQHHTPGFQTPSTQTATYTKRFTGHEHAITIFNPMQASTIRCDTTVESATSEGFMTVRITDYDTRTFEYSKTGSSFNSYAGIEIVDWIGEHYQDKNGLTKKLVPTRSMINSVEIFEYYGTTGNIEFDLTKGQNPDQVVPFVNHAAQASDHNNIRNFKAAYVYSDPDMIRVKFGGGATADREVTVYAVEFCEDIKIQKGNTYGLATDVQVEIEPVNLDRTFLHFYAHSDVSGRFPQYNSVLGKFTSASGIQFERHSGTGTMYIGWYVVEAPDNDRYWKVQHSYEGWQGGTTTYNKPDRYASMNSSVLLVSYASSCDSDYPQRGAARVGWYWNSNIQFYKSDGNNSFKSNCEIIEMEPEQIRKGFRTISGYVNLNTTSQIDYNINNDNNSEYYIDLNRYMILSSNQNNTGASRTSIESGWEECFHSYRLIDGNTVRAQKRGGANFNTDSFYYLYELPEYNKYYMEGYTKEQGDPVPREVRSYRASTGELTDITMSVSGTGYFFLESRYNDAHYVVCLDNEAGLDYNDLIYGRIYPTVISGTFHYNTTSGIGGSIPLGRL
jgi:hypothetical protein